MQCKCNVYTMETSTITTWRKKSFQEVPFCLAPATHSILLYGNWVRIVYLNHLSPLVLVMLSPPCLLIESTCLLLHSHFCWLKSQFSWEAPPLLLALDQYQPLPNTSQFTLCQGFKMELEPWLRTTSPHYHWSFEVF